MRLDDEKVSSNIRDGRQSGTRTRVGGKTGVLGLLIVLVGAYYGVDLSGVVGLGQGNYSEQSSQQSAAQDELYTFSGKVLTTTERVWQRYFQQNGLRYQAPLLQVYSDYYPTACGTGQAAMGPFYCPSDQTIYLDLSFYNEMKTKMRAGGDFAFAYVIAHEVGHHIQNQLGIFEKTQKAQRNAGSRAEVNRISVQVELQADCFAGVWGHQVQQEGRLDEGDVEEAFNAAAAVGDDRLQQQSTGRVVPDSFTHGSSKQRLAWFKKGLYSGDPSQCNTFSSQ